MGLRPGLSDLPARRALTGQWLRDDPEHALLTATALAAWVVLAWLTLGLVVCALTAVPGTAGSVAERLSRHVVPATVRRAAGLAIGASLATAPVLSAGTALAAPAARRAVTAPAVPEGSRRRRRCRRRCSLRRNRQTRLGKAHGPEAGHPIWPAPLHRTAWGLDGHHATASTNAIGRRRHRLSHDHILSGTTAPDATSSSAPRPPYAAPASPWATNRTRAFCALDQPSGPGLAGRALPRPGSGTYRFRRGDCLWSIAARCLGPGTGPTAIEAASHRLIPANRDVIGTIRTSPAARAAAAPPSG